MIYSYFHLFIIRSLFNSFSGLRYHGSRRSFVHIQDEFYQLFLTSENLLTKVHAAPISEDDIAGNNNF